MVVWYYVVVDVAHRWSETRLAVFEGAPTNHEVIWYCVRAEGGHVVYTHWSVRLSLAKG